MQREPNWDRLTVLVVEDNSFMRLLTANTIRALGIGEVAVAEDGAAAIKRLKAGRTDPAAAELGIVDIVLSDYLMPVVDGKLLLRWIRTGSDTPDRFVPFVMVSGAADRDVVEQARDGGVTDFLAKPFSAQSMADRILSVINNPRQFVLTEGYFGPDRRRTDQPAEHERRVIDPAQIQIVHKASSKKRLRDDVKVIYFRFVNRLRDKLGVNSLKGQVDIDPAFIRAADERIHSFFGDYADWVRRSVRDMIAARDALAAGEGEAMAHIAAIAAIAHELRGQSGIFDYPLITRIAKSLYEATSDPAVAVTPSRIELIGAHIDTIRNVFADKVTGDGGDTGAALLREMEAAVKKFNRAGGA